MIERHYKSILFFMYFFLSLLRLPHVVQQGGRFIFEDGTIFFSYAWHFASVPALFHTFGGYLNLAANALTLLAARLVQYGVLPLRFVPAVLCSFAFLIQLVPAVLVLWGRIVWLERPLAKAGAVLSIACAAMSEEAWLSIMHVQLWLTLSCILLLVSLTPQKWYSWLGEGTILFLAPLCGISAILTAPFFLLSAIKERSPKRCIQLFILLLGGALQLGLFYRKSPVRRPVHDVSMLSDLIFLRLESVTFFGSFARYMGKAYEAAYGDLLNGHGGWWYGLTALALPAVAGAVYLCWRYRFTDAGTLFCLGFFIAFMSFLGGPAMNGYDFLQPRLGGHYNFLPTVCFVLGFLALWQTMTNRYAVKWAKRAYLWVLCVALASYPFNAPASRNGSAWPKEVSLWQKDHNYRPRTWLGATVDLSSKHEPCPDISREPTSFTAPAYCEALWNAVMLRSEFHWPD